MSLSFVCGLRRFARSEDGAMSVWGLFLFLAAATISAAAVDVTYLYAVRTELQVAADTAAQAAVLRRNQGVSAEESQDFAVRLVQHTMPEEVHGEVIGADNIRFGTYDAATDTFRLDPTSREAVLVETQRSQASGNPAPTLLFRMIGLRQMDVNVSAVARSYVPPCLNEGFTAEGIITVTSNNAYYRGFCIHSNTHVELSQHNAFELGTHVSMPDLDDLEIPNSGFTNNPGLQQALREQYITIGILDRIRADAANPLETALLTVGDPDRPSYITSTQVRTLPGTTSNSNTSYTPAAFTAGHVHRRTCSNANQTITLPGGLYSSFVLLTNCRISISGKSDLRNVVLYTTNTSSTSVTGDAGGGGQIGVWLGRDDSCGAGGGAQIITRGGFRNSAKLTLSGGQIIALGNVIFHAHATGIGASIISGGYISGTSLMEFSGCGTGMEDNFNVELSQLAR